MYTGPKIVTDGLLYAVDAGSKRCYPGAGSDYVDIIDPTRGGSFWGGITYSSAKGGHFDADDNASGISIPDSVGTALNGLPEATLEMYIRTKANTIASDSGIIQLSAWDSTNGNLYFYNNGSTYLDVFKTNRLSLIPSPTWIDPTKWHQLTITSKVGAAGYRVFFDAIYYKGTTGQTIAVTNDIGAGLFLGRNSNSRYLDGGIGVVRIYTKALTDEEVMSNYKATINRYR